MDELDPREVLGALQRARESFLALVEEVRPELHRYCARMTGSVTDGEDIVQDTLARAYYRLPELHELPALRTWLFRIAHNASLDYLRSRERSGGEPLEVALDLEADPDSRPEHEPMRKEAISSALAHFLELPPGQRSCVILKDVLGYTLEQLAEVLEMTVPAVKAALHRGRRRLAEPTAAPPAAAVSPALERYAELFNARDWDGVLAMLVDEVKLDLVSHHHAEGRSRVASYFSNYDRAGSWRVVPGTLDGREALGVFGSADERTPAYFIEIAFDGERVAAIRDYRFVPYLAGEATFVAS